jgi:hypothetical protein
MSSTKKARLFPKKKKRIPPTKPDTPTRAKESDLRSKQVAFLTAVAELGTITRAALAAGVHRSMHYDWLNDEAYTKAFNDAEEMFRDSVRTEAHRRAVEGWLEPVVYQGRIQFVEELDSRGRVKKGKDGKPIAHMVAVRKFSDRLLELHAKAKCPEYRDKHEITGAGGGPVTLQVITGVPQPEGI